MQFANILVRESHFTLKKIGNAPLTHICSGQWGLDPGITTFKSLSAVTALSPQALLHCSTSYETLTIPGNPFANPFLTVSNEIEWGRGPVIQYNFGWLQPHAELAYSATHNWTLSFIMSFHSKCHTW